MKMQMWTGYIVSPLTERKKCLLRLNVKWQNMISLQERLRMMQQTLLLPLILRVLLGLQDDKVADDFMYQTVAAE